MRQSGEGSERNLYGSSAYYREDTTIEERCQASEGVLAFALFNLGEGLC